MADVRRFSDAEINRLVKFYEQAEREILDRLNRALLRGNKTEYLAQMKKNIEAILRQLREGNRTWCSEAIPRVYSQGLYSADAMLKDAGVSIKAGFGAIHQQAAQVLAENTFQRLEDVVQVIGRQVNDIYRELALENVRGAVVGYDTWKQTARRYREQLAERGVTGFKDRTGRMWNMRTYTKMVARTTTMEAHLQGTANRLVEQGHDLIKVSTHRGACPLCEPWQGKILSITGKTKGYPTLEEAKAAGLFHPNCRHAYGLYIDLDKEIEGTETDRWKASSIAEAERYGIESGAFTHEVDYSGKKIYTRSFMKKGGGDLETANIINNTVLHLKDKYRFGGPLRSVQVETGKTMGQGVVASMSPGNTLTWRWDHTTANVDIRATFTVGEQLAKTPADVIRATLVHEYGHAIHHNLLRAAKKGDPEARSILGRWNKIATAQNVPWRKISNYASSKKSEDFAEGCLRPEGFAEAFSAFELGATDRLTPEMNEIFKELLR